MIINKQWYLGDNLRPISRTLSPTRKATRDQFDSVAIIHFPASYSFRPIVLGDTYIYSLIRWSPKNFYKGIIRCLDSLEADRRGWVGKVSGYDIRVGYRSVYWGCRSFTKPQLKTIKKTLEENYTKKQLGIK